ncbi:hypothetical protein [Telluria beijingensis]|uniref:hypothetical protein n=1 Tax=Telluria beijingensis TaxID=3068633 RepID=UPI0027963BAA|nr:hypothetical protein [Massilia sp. REN29]
MNIALLHLTGPDSALAAFCDALQLEPSASWKAGDARSRGKVHASSGCTIDIADAPTPSAMLESIRRFLERCETGNVILPAYKLHGELSIGIAVGDAAQFAAVLEFTARDLQRIAASGATLTVAAYPVAD